MIRDEEQAGFAELFAGVVRARFPEFAEKRFTSDLNLEDFAAFVGKSVLGNMRSFIFACNYVADSEDRDRSVGLPTLGRAFLDMTTKFYWPLIEEVRPKLGKYVPVVEPAEKLPRVFLPSVEGSKILLSLFTATSSVAFPRHLKFLSMSASFRNGNHLRQ